jgi:hypothetical protein
MMIKRRKEKPVAKPEAMLSEIPYVVANAPASPAQETPVQEKTNDQPKAEEKAKEPKVKKVRYATVDAIPDNAVVTWFKPEAKGPTGKSKSSIRYNRYYRTGITVAEFCQAYKDNNEPRMLARNDLRWDLQHGLITLEVPQSKAAE